MVPPGREKARGTIERTTPRTESPRWRKALLWGEEIPIGKFFERTDVPTLHGADPVLNAGPFRQADTRIPVDVIRACLEELM
jgi:hypothetical protein